MVRKLKLRGFILQRQKDGEDLAPSIVREAFIEKANRNITIQSVSEMLKSMGLDKSGRAALVVENARVEAGKDILDFPQWSKYVTQAEQGRVQQHRIKGVGLDIRWLWELMGKTNPEKWDYTELMKRIENQYPKIINEKDQRVFKSPAAVLKKLGSLNTVFQGIVPPNFSADLSRKAGELKDFFTFEEFKLFIENCTDSEEMSAQGWRALFTAQINGGFREGTNERNGILGLTWENIQFNDKRCTAIEKGGRGNASRKWLHVPLNLFPWLNGWNLMKEWFIVSGSPTTGRCFPVRYETYLNYFHKTRRACNGRISGDKETFRPHIFRKSHAQWLRKLRVPLEIIGGAFPDGYYGVGWDDVDIIRKYYVSIEPEEYDEAQQKAETRMKALGLA